MYKSPIDVIYGEMAVEIQNGIFKTVQKYDVRVDEKELKKALAYDREQYEKGYAEGYREGVKNVEEKLRRMLREALDWEEEMGK